VGKNLITLNLHIVMKYRLKTDYRDKWGKIFKKFKVQKNVLICHQKYRLGGSVNKDENR